MDTIIERDTGSSVVILFLGILVIAVLGSLALYFLRIYPFNAMAEPTNTIEINLPEAATASNPSAN